MKFRLLIALLVGMPLAAWAQIDIRTYGAVCNGVKDDSAAVQAAFNAVGQGGTISVPCTAAIGPSGVILTGKTNVTVAGQNGGGFLSLVPTTLGAQGFGPVTFVVQFCTGCTIENLTFNGNNVNVVPLAFDRCTNTTASGNNISNVGYANAGIAGTGNTSNHYVGNTVNKTSLNAAGTDGARGMWIGNISSNEVEWYPTISNNTITNTAATGIASTVVGAEVSGNVVDTTLGSCYKLEYPTSGSGQSIIENNTFRHCAFNGIQLNSVTGVIVRNNLMELNQGPGIYIWQGFVNSQVTGNTIQNNDTNMADGWQGGIMVGAASGSTISNNTIQDTRSGTARTQDNGILIQSTGIQNLTISGNTCSNHWVSGIYVANHPSQPGPITNLVIANNQCNNNADFGLEIWQTMANGIPNATVSGNVFTGNGEGTYRSNVPVSFTPYVAPVTTRTTPPVLSNGQPTGTLPVGTASTTLSLVTDETATCHYSTSPGVAYAVMTGILNATSGTSQSAVISNLVAGTAYSYYVRCQDTYGNVNTSDYLIAFSTAAAPVVSTGNTPPSSPALWLKADAGVVATSSQITQWTDQSGNNNQAMATGAAEPTLLSAATGGLPAVHFNGVANTLTVSNSASLNMGGGSFTISAWTRSPLTDSIGGLMRKGDGPFTTNGGGWELRNQMTLLEFARGTRVGVANRLQTFITANTWYQLTIVYDSVAGMETFYVNGSPVSTVASSGSYADSYDLNIGLGRDGYFIGDMAEILMYSRALSASDLTLLQQYLTARYSGAPVAPTRTAPPVLTSGSPTGTLAAGTTSTTLSLSSDENATCRYSTSAGMSYASMTNVFTTTGGTTQSVTVAGLQNSTSYVYYVRCKDASGNTDPADYKISFSVAAPPPQSTSSSAPPTGSVVWLRADQGVTATNSLVSQWGDQSGANNNAVQSVSADQPTLIPNDVNGLPAVRFNATTTYLDIANSPTINFGSNSFTISYLFSSSLTDGITGQMRKGNSSFDLNGVGFEFRTQTKLLEFTVASGNGAAPRLQYTFPSGNQWYNVTVVYNAATLTATLYVNGTLASTQTMGGPYADTYDLQIGVGRDGYMDGDIAELLVYPRALSSADLSTLATYLKGKYGTP